MFRTPIWPGSLRSAHLFGPKADTYRFLWPGLKFNHGFFRGADSPLNFRLKAHGSHLLEALLPGYYIFPSIDINPKKPDCRLFANIIFTIMSGDTLASRPPKLTPRPWCAQISPQSAIQPMASKVPSFQELVESVDPRGSAECSSKASPLERRPPNNVFISTLLACMALRSPVPGSLKPSTLIHVWDYTTLATGTLVFLELSAANADS